MGKREDSSETMFANSNLHSLHKVRTDHNFQNIFIVDFISLPSKYYPYEFDWLITYLIFPHLAIEHIDCISLPH